MWGAMQRDARALAGVELLESLRCIINWQELMTGASLPFSSVPVLKYSVDSDTVAYKMQSNTI